MSENSFLGIDIGTSSVKAVVFDDKGFQLFRSVKQYSLKTSPNGYAELNPDTVLSACLHVMKESFAFAENKGGITGIGFCALMLSVMAIDSRGKPLTQLMTWADNRAAEEARFIEENFDSKELYMKTGCRVHHPLYPLTKILWLKKHHPDIAAQIWKYITIKDYILLHLTGDLAADITTASTQGYFNTHSHTWDEDICKNVLSSDTSCFPEIRPCISRLPELKKEIRDYLEIKNSIPVTLGTGDGIAAHLGCGIRDEKAISSTLGTSGAIRRFTKSPLLDPLQRTWCYGYTEKKWIAGGAINNGGIVLTWLLNMFGQKNTEEAYSAINKLAGETPPGSEGVMFLPLLTGERSPNWNSDLRGSVFGLDFHHSRKHLLRAAMEGIMFRMFSIFEIITEGKKDAVQVLPNGGYANSPVWLQIQADIFGRSIRVPKSREASSLGAAFLAMASQGFISEEDVLPGMKTDQKIDPVHENTEVYAELYKKHLQIYKATVDLL